MTTIAHDYAGAAPAVSVIIPAYNAETTLTSTLNSVLSQSLRDIEVVVIDDGSTDGTREVAQSHAAHDRRVRVIHKSNSGVADARNAGIAAARGAYVASIDADDVWHPCFLEKLRDALEANGEEYLFAFAFFRKIDMSGSILASGHLYDVNGRAFNRFLIKNFVGNGSGMMFRRDAALAVGGYERRLQHEFGAPGCEDWLFQLRLANRGNVVAVPEYLVGYRLVPGAMSSNYLTMLWSRIHAFEILFEEVGCGDTAGARWGLGRAHAEFMARAFLSGRVTAGFRMLGRALALDTPGTLNYVVKELAKFHKRAIRRAIAPARRMMGWRPDSRSFVEVDPLDDLQEPRHGLEAKRLAKMRDADSNGYRVVSTKAYAKTM